MTLALGGQQHVDPGTKKGHHKEKMPRQGLVTEVQALELSDDGLLLPSLSSKLIAGNVIIKVVMIFFENCNLFWHNSSNNLASDTFLKILYYFIRY